MTWRSNDGGISSPVRSLDNRSPDGTGEGPSSPTTKFSLMKQNRHLLLLLVAALLSFLPAFAQADLPYLPSGDHYTVTIARTSLLYPLSPAETASVREKAAGKAYDDTVVNPSARKHVRVARGKDLQVVGYARSVRDIGYDLYVVSIGDALFYMSPEYVVDNSVLEKKNYLIVDMYNDISERLDAKRDEWRRLALSKAPAVEAGLRKASFDEARRDAIVDSLVALRTAGMKDPFQRDSVRTATVDEVLASLAERRAAWTARKEYLVNPGEGNDKVADYFADEIAVYREITAIQDEMASFERRNFLR